ncbi:MAG: hypothetical protein LBP54_04660 [Campylobacteraceae bacterium]|jgi:hypothetical protein|nr:hypothetical protein [Campylobacteraceae bacterium]
MSGFWVIFPHKKSFSPQLYLFFWIKIYLTAVVWKFADLVLEDLNYD